MNQENENLDENKLMKWTYYVVSALLLIMVLWGIWNNYEKTKLNQRYERVIERSEQLNAKLQTEIDRWKTFNDRIDDVFKQK
ncbi:MAG: hypothetical protein QJR05_13435 [Thermoanaerobacterium sp.]|nr:hypothetical protein [Thermoanaerobacterium sp.]